MIPCISHSSSYRLYEYSFIFQLRCLSEDETHNCSMMTKPGATSVTVNKLDADQKYRIQLAAVTSQGHGKWSKVYIIGKVL